MKINFKSLSILSPLILIACVSTTEFGTNTLRFAENESNLPGSYQRIDATAAGVSAPFVERFSIVGGDCASTAYGDSASKGDCNFGSVRSMLREVHADGRWQFTQPQQAWYGFDILIPQNFPLRGKQTRGSYIFAQWKGKTCPHLALSHSTNIHGDNSIYLRLQTRRGDPQSFDCSDVAVVPLMNVRQFAGAWKQVQVFAIWSDDNDGQIRAYINGVLVGSYDGRTLNYDPAGPNNFDVGVYLCCTGGTQLVRSGSIYFANVHRAATRDQLSEFMQYP